MPFTSFDGDLSEVRVIYQCSGLSPGYLQLTPECLKRSPEGDLLRLSALCNPTCRRVAMLAVNSRQRPYESVSLSSMSKENINNVSGSRRVWKHDQTTYPTHSEDPPQGPARLLADSFCDLLRKLPRSPGAPWDPRCPERPTN